MYVRTVLTGMLLALQLMVTFAWADMYRWVDRNGVITFKDYPPPASKKRKEIKVYSESNFDPATSRQSASTPATHGNKRSESKSTRTMPSRDERFNGTVEIYVTEWCGYCKKAIAYMKSRNIPFVAHDIEKDSSARQRHADMGGRGVPLIIIGKNKMSGFSPETLEYYLGQK